MYPHAGEHERPDGFGFRYMYSLSFYMLEILPRVNLSNLIPVEARLKIALEPRNVQDGEIYIKLLLDIPYGLNGGCSSCTIVANI